MIGWRASAFLMPRSVWVAIKAHEMAVEYAKIRETLERR